VAPSPSPTPTSPSPTPTADKKVVLPIVQFIGVLLFAIGLPYYALNNLAERENKLRDEIVKVADNLTALDTSIRSVASSEVILTKQVNANFSKVQGRLEAIEKTTKVFVPPSLSVSDISTEALNTAKQ
jgi:hypothetical protein